MSLDEILWAFLAEEIGLYQVFPPPPRVPVFAAVTVRPGQVTS